jgi:hypothetical protein
MNTNSRYLGQKLFFRHSAVPTTARDMACVLHDYIENSPPAESADRITIANIICLIIVIHLIIDESYHVSRVRHTMTYYSAF